MEEEEETWKRLRQLSYLQAVQRASVFQLSRVVTHARVGFWWHSCPQIISGLVSNPNKTLQLTMLNFGGILTLSLCNSLGKEAFVHISPVPHNRDPICLSHAFHSPGTRKMTVAQALTHQWQCLQSRWFASVSIARPDFSGSENHVSLIFVTSTGQAEHGTFSPHRHEDGNLMFCGGGQSQCHCPQTGISEVWYFKKVLVTWRGRLEE